MPLFHPDAASGRFDHADDCFTPANQGRPLPVSAKMQPCVTVAEVARRWQVDRATARYAIAQAGIAPSAFYATPRYCWLELLEKIEGWPATMLNSIDVWAPLETAEVLADRMCVTPQTIRNYGRTGRLHRIEITPRAVRYSLQQFAKTGSEEKTAAPHQK